MTQYYRCYCNRLLGKGQIFSGAIEIKCPRCKQRYLINQNAQAHHSLKGNYECENPKHR